MKKTIFLLISTLIASKTLTSQLKIGMNATSIDTSANFQVQSSNGSHFIINKNSGNVGINNLVPTTTLDINGNLRVRFIENIDTTKNLKIVLADSLGNLKEISTSSFLDALNVPRQVVSSRVQGNQQIGQSNGLTQVLFPIEDIDTENAFQNSVFTANSSDTYTISCMISCLASGASASTWWQSMTLFYCPAGSSSWVGVISDWKSGLYFSDINNSNQIHWSGKLNVGDKIRISIMNTHTQLNNISQGSIVITKL